jgi:hypothetical protein
MEENGRKNTVVFGAESLPKTLRISFVFAEIPRGRALCPAEFAASS